MSFLDRRAELEGWLQRIGDTFDEDDLAGAKREIRRALRQFPESLDLKEWEAATAIAEERFRDALKILEEILEKDPWRPYGLRERASVLVDLGRFQEAQEALHDIVDQKLLEEDDASEEARVHYEIGLCLDREGKTKEADEEFHEAVRLAPGEQSVPSRMNIERFEVLVADALDALPEHFHPYLRQVSVVVRDYPSPQEIDPGGLDPFALGLYSGVPRTERTWESRDNLDQIVVFKRNHELLNLGPEELREEVRKTVVHEIAHHFGLGEDDMGEYA